MSVGMGDSLMLNMLEMGMSHMPFDDLAMSISDEKGRVAKEAPARPIDG